MDKSRLHDLIRASRTDRRAFIRHLASLGLASLVMPFPLRAARGADEMTYFTWASYEIPELHMAYVEKYGGSPAVTFYADEEEALAKLRTGFPVDVAHPCNTSVQRWYEAEVIRPIDPSRLTYWDNLIPALRDIPGTKVDGQPLFVTMDWGSDSVAYRSDLIDPAYADERGWELLLDESYAGRLAMFDSVSAAVAFAAVVMGIRDTTNVTDAQFDQIKDILRRQKDVLRAYWTSESEGEAMMASGEVAASYLWAGPVFRLQEAGIPAVYMLNPKGGIISWACGLVMTTTGSGDEEAVYDFINAMTSPETGKFIIEEFGYGHVNNLTYDLVDADLLVTMGLDGDVGEYLANSVQYQSWEADLMSRYVAMFDEVKLGI